jgi:hypothetical protein
MHLPWIASRNRHALLVRRFGVAVVLAAVAVSALKKHGGRGAHDVVAYLPVAELESGWGRLIAAANIAMHARSPGSDRVGFFRAADGTLWGLPLAVPDANGRVSGCAPPELRAARVTDSLPADVVEILGASDFFSDARAGTAGVHLLVRGVGGGIRWHRVSASEYVSPTGMTCREAAVSRHRDPLPRYHYFRITSVR